jgi:hypothetical protein
MSQRGLTEVGKFACQVNLLDLIRVRVKRICFSAQPCPKGVIFLIRVKESSVTKQNNKLTNIIER